MRQLARQLLRCPTKRRGQCLERRHPYRRRRHFEFLNDIELRSAETPVLRLSQSIHGKAGRKRNDVNAERRAAQEPGAAQRRVETRPRERRARRGRRRRRRTRSRSRLRASCPARPGPCSARRFRREKQKSCPRVLATCMARYPTASPLRYASTTSYLRAGDDRKRHWTHEASRTAENIASVAHRVQSRSKLSPACATSRNSICGSWCRRLASQRPQTCERTVARRSHGKPRRRAAKTSGRSGRTSHCKGNKLCQPAAAVLDPHRSFGKPSVNATPCACHSAKARVTPVSADRGGETPAPSSRRRRSSRW